MPCMYSPTSLTEPSNFTSLYVYMDINMTSLLGLGETVQIVLLG